MDWIYEKIDRGDKLFRNDVHAYGWDRAYNKKKTLEIRWRCCYKRTTGGCDVLTHRYDENAMVPLYG